MGGGRGGRYPLWTCALIFTSLQCNCSSQLMANLVTVMGPSFSLFLAFCSFSFLTSPVLVPLWPPWALTIHIICWKWLFPLQPLYFRWSWLICRKSGHDKDLSAAGKYGFSLIVHDLKLALPPTPYLSVGSFVFWSPLPGNTKPQWLPTAAAGRASGHKASHSWSRL